MGQGKDKERSGCRKILRSAETSAGLPEVETKVMGRGARINRNGLG